MTTALVCRRPRESFGDLVAVDDLSFELVTGDPLHHALCRLPTASS